jgi:hypothetical protein
MNRLSREAIDEFRTIFTNEFGEELTDDEIGEMGWRLLRFFDILGREVPQKAEKPVIPNRL